MFIDEIMRSTRLTAVPRSSAMEYTFTLKYQFAKDDCDPSVLVERLGEAGCDDALVGIGQPGCYSRTK